MSSGVVIRPARQEDLSDVYSIELESFKHPYPKRVLAFYLNLFPQCFFVAEVGQRVVGYAIGIIEKDSVGHVISIAVAPGYRRRGIGERLMRELLRAFKCYGARSAFLEVRVSNLPARSLYRKLGFRPVKIVPRYYPDGEDCLVMLKDEL